MRSFCQFLAVFLGLAYVASGQTVLNTLAPSSVAAGSPAVSLSVFGSNFSNGETVLWNGIALVTSFQDSELLTASVPASLIASPGTATVSISGGSNSLSFSITGGALAVSTTSLPNGTVGQPYSASMTASGGTPPYTWSVTAGALPGGLGLSSSGSFSGTPAASGTSSFTVQLTDSAHSVAVATLSITVNAPAFAITTSSLPGGVAGQAYSQQLAASGGTPPYDWSGQSLPAGLSINTSGLLSGTPSASGTFTFTIQVTDSATPQDSASQSFTVTFAVAGLTINTLSPLLSGVVGTAYSAPALTASGGTPPYTWSITSGSVPGLSLVSSTGMLQGTPTAAGTFSLTIRVTDSAGHQASQNYSLTVAAPTTPTLTIIAIATPPNGIVGMAYPSQNFSVVGTSPYTAVSPFTWSASGVPGLTISASGTLSGTPTTGGAFTLTVQATDANGVTGTRTFPVTIIANLSITSATQLPDTTLGSAFTYTMTATGGTPPYTWSANGLPSGVSINSSTGVISGTPGTAGTISFTVTVVDSAQTSASNLFHLNVIPQPLPALTITGLPNTATPLQQYTVTLTLASPYPSADISGTAILTSQPADNGPNDTSIQFSSGGQSASFVISAGNTMATLKIQVGTVAGTINLTVTHVLTGGFDVTPSPPPTASTQLAAAAPVITSATARVSGSTLTILIAGYATSREVTQMVFNFGAATGQSLAASQFTIPVNSIFGPYYQNAANAAYGSQFVFTQPFTIQGNASAVIPQSVTLTNRVGSTTAQVSQ